VSDARLLAPRSNRQQATSSDEIDIFFTPRALDFVTRRKAHDASSVVAYH